MVCISQNEDGLGWICRTRGACASIGGTRRPRQANSNDAATRVAACWLVLLLDFDNDDDGEWARLLKRNFTVTFLLCHKIARKNSMNAHFVPNAVSCLIIFLIAKNSSNS
jgi:hypothetical protein